MIAGRTGYPRDHVNTYRGYLAAPLPAQFWPSALLNFAVANTARAAINLLQAFAVRRGMPGSEYPRHLTDRLGA